MHKILFATGNKAKVADFQPVFVKAGLLLEQAPKLPEIQEDEDTLLGNARIKAMETSKLYPNILVLGNDGGVEIPFLGKKWNMLLTKRLSGLDMGAKFSEKQRAETLLELMKPATSSEERRVLWSEAFVIVINGKVVFEHVHSGAPGVLVREIPPTFQEDGFWLGWLWLDPKFGKVYMELSDEEKFLGSDNKQSLLAKLLQSDFLNFQK